MAVLDTSRIVKADPTKDFFISMLVKDINVDAAIIDLVDNCTDGALRIRGSGRYDGLWVLIDAMPDHFKIADNCGGIDVEVARNYAFNFGRRPEAAPLAHSVGQFGVGMKRALFKLGKKFKIRSTTKSSSFEIKVDVEEWRRDTDPQWTFRFSDLHEGRGVSYPEDECGTVITVTSLHEGVAKDFEFPDTLNELRREVGERHQENIARGLKITLNGVPVDLHLAKLLSSDLLKAAYRFLRLRAPNGSFVKARVYAGLHDDQRENPHNAGWYVFCNGRMILRANQESVTGWGEGNGEGIPNYHPQYSRFRGYVFFESIDGSVLPWNTTKTGVDESSPIYRSTKLIMLTLMRSVINFLNQLKTEETISGGEAGPLHSALNGASPSTLQEAKKAPNFVAPRPLETAPGQVLERITYEKPAEEVDRVKECLGVRSKKEVGEKTFEYYLEMECSE